MTLTHYKIHFFAILAGITCGAFLYPGAFPDGDYPWLAWFLMMPLVFGSYYLRPYLASLMWTLYALCLWWTSTSWLTNYLGYVFKIPMWQTYSLIVFMCFICAIPYALTGYITARWQILHRTGGVLLFSALLAVLVEVLPVPFPGDLSMSFYRIPVWTQVADIGGSHFIHFIIIFINALLAKVVYGYYSRRCIDFKSLVIALSVFLLVTAYGYMRLEQFHELYESAPEDAFASIGFVQPNIPGSDLSQRYGDYFPEEEMGNDLGTTIDQLYGLANSSQDLDFLVIPEITHRVPYPANPGLESHFDEIITIAGAPILYADVYPYVKAQGFFTGWSAMLQVDTDLNFSVVYKKANLIPFAEFLPFEDTFPIFRQWFPKVNQFEAGEGVVLPMNENIQLIPFICYDAIFPNYVRKLVAEKGGNMMLTLDNDVNFGPTKASHVHLSVMLYRTIEHRKPLLRVSNSGPSMLIKSSGEILKSSETPLYQRDSRIVRVLPGSQSVHTIYQKGGHLVTVFLLILGCIVVTFSRSRRS